jgi:hypothetical protein
VVAVVVVNITEMVAFVVEGNTEVVGGLGWAVTGVVAGGRKDISEVVVVVV